MANEKHILFVYGTLKRSCHNYPYLQRLSHRFLSEGDAGKEYSLYVGSLPFLVREPGEGASGELFLVDDEALRFLDRLEGHPNHYRREKISVSLPSGEKVSAWAYLYQYEIPKGTQRIKSYEGRPRFYR